MSSTTEASEETRAKPPIRVFIVDDHELVRNGLRAIIGNESDLMVCGEAADLTDALERIQQSQPDVAIIDIVLKSGDGLNLVKSIRERFPAVRTIVLSVYTEELYGERALRAGATGYVCKEQPVGEILHSIRQAFLGLPCFSQALVDRTVDRHRGRGNLAAQSPIETLSDRELEVFRCIGQGLPSIEIAKQLQLSRSTIDTYRERLKSKLGLSNTNALTRGATLWVAQNGGAL